eukprot:TRINITY_DN1507_c0_g1_i2.p1 TRINITY_DN1507_c0_g1~~TRINITY_DN1507_c0_g1_i2.p1  ORF type:complete len:558 (+),score=82.44 TRINITY_DN1507_c0_g1_i2:80-1675(+)
MSSVSRLHSLAVIFLVLSFLAYVCYAEVTNTYCVDDSCDEVSYTCTGGDTCNYHCSGYQSCVRNNYTCTDGATCNFYCNSNLSCLVPNIVCKDATCTAYGIGDTSLANFVMECSNSTCLLQCEGYFACRSGTRTCSPYCEKNCVGNCEDDHAFNGLSFDASILRKNFLGSFIGDLTAAGFRVDNFLLRLTDGQILMRKEPLDISRSEEFKQALGLTLGSQWDLVDVASKIELFVFDDGRLVEFTLDPSFPNFSILATMGDVGRFITNTSVPHLDVTSVSMSFTLQGTNPLEVITDTSPRFVPIELAPAILHAMFKDLLFALGSVPKKYIVAGEVVFIEQNTGFFTELFYSSDPEFPCKRPQPFEGSWCVNGVWTVPEQINLSLPELFIPNSPVVYEQGLTTTESSHMIVDFGYTDDSAEQPGSNLNITITGCATFAGELEVTMSPSFTGGDIDLMHYDCSEGEFDVVTVTNGNEACTVLPTYDAGRLHLIMPPFGDPCPNSLNSAASSLTVSLVGSFVCVAVSLLLTLLSR